MEQKPSSSAVETIQVPAFSIPDSSFLSQETKSALLIAREAASELSEAYNSCPPLKDASPAAASSIRDRQATLFYKTSSYRRLRARYDVIVESETIGGVYTEVFTPADGVAPENERRVLINLHGGGFQTGARTLSHLESIPIASVGKIKVISVDYRMAPEYVFPAASRDVEAVYRELLKVYSPRQIGIYGCSAGGVLTAEVVAWLHNERLPSPGAVAMFCGAGSFWTEGDSGYLMASLSDVPIAAPQDNPFFAYFKESVPNDPLVFPSRSSEVLAAFPPSLLVTATRDVALSSVVHTHSILFARGVETQLHVLEGLGHAFVINPDLPESRGVFESTVRFFERHLAAK